MHLRFAARVTFHYFIFFVVLGALAHCAECLSFFLNCFSVYAQKNLRFSRAFVCVPVSLSLSLSAYILVVASSFLVIDVQTKPRTYNTISSM
jgi:hypothetical protein